MWSKTSLEFVNWQRQIRFKETQMKTMFSSLFFVVVTMSFCQWWTCFLFFFCKTFRNSCGFFSSSSFFSSININIYTNRFFFFINLQWNISRCQIFFVVDKNTQVLLHTHRDIINKLFSIHANVSLPSLEFYYYHVIYM